MRVPILAQPASTPEVPAAPPATTTETGSPAPTPQGAPRQQQGGFESMLFMFLFMFAIIWFVMIRPQQKKERERQAMLKTLKKNDRVYTVGGLYGTIVNMQEDEVTLRIDDDSNVRARFARSAIVAVAGGSEQKS